MATPRGGLPFIWTSWLTGLLSGEQQCVYAAAFKSHYRYDKVPDATFDLAAWNADHTALLERRRQELVAEGWRVRVENENAFRLKGSSAVLAGKPDLISVRGHVVRIIDGKTGAVKNKDWHQVLIYAWAVPKAFPEFSGWTIEGEVAYRTHNIPIGPHELTPERIDAIAVAIKQVAATVLPQPVPSARECSQCDLAGCAARIETPIAEALVGEF